MLKKCSKCGTELPDTEFYKRGKYFYGVCKQCISKERKEYYIQNREEVIRRVVEYKREYRKIPENWEKELKWSGNWRDKNRDKIREINKRNTYIRLRYQKNNPEKIRVIQKRHREKYKKEHGKGIDSKYYPRYKEKILEKDRKRRVKKRSLLHTFTKAEWEQKIAETNNICPMCHRPFSEVKPFIPTLDHSPPVSKASPGFQYTIKDVTPLCGSCNSSKGNRF